MLGLLKSLRVGLGIYEFQGVYGDDFGVQLLKDSVLEEHGETRGRV
jgi:hypothetical protein